MPFLNVTVRRVMVKPFHNKVMGLGKYVSLLKSNLIPFRRYGPLSVIPMSFSSYSAGSRKKELFFFYPFS